MAGEKHAAFLTRSRLIPVSVVKLANFISTLDAHFGTYTLVVVVAVTSVAVGRSWAIPSAEPSPSRSSGRRAIRDIKILTLAVLESNCIDV